MTQASPTTQDSWLDRPLFSAIRFDWEKIVFALILILALLSRFSELGTRVMSHDETSHVYFSWQLYRGQGYGHSPITHGPLQFHLIALSYFLFGDSDFSGRAPAALFSVAAIAFLWAFRRYLGRVGAIVAAGLFLISPYMMYYGRYARNEAFVGLFGLMTLWAILRYLDRGETKHLYFLAAATALHFTTKETAFIYTAQALIFLGLLFLGRIGGRHWKRPGFRVWFFIIFGVGLLLAMAAIGVNHALVGQEAAVSGTEVQEPVVAGETPGQVPILQPPPPGVLYVGGAAGLVILAGLGLLISGYGWERLREERSFSLMVVLFTLALPHLAAFPVLAFNGDPLNYTDSNNLMVMGMVVMGMVLLSAGLGLAWRPRAWLICLGIFYVIFIPLYTTIFTNQNGFFSGLVGSLGYWLEQQGVKRGNQPSYYYWGIQIPIYEYLAAAGTLLAAWAGMKILRRGQKEKPSTEDHENRNLRPGESRRLALSLFAFWAATSLIAYTVAGEKMPWLTYHIALPMLLLSGWAFGRLLKGIDWGRFKDARGMLSIALAITLALALLGAFGALWGTAAPFQGLEREQLQDTYQFLFLVIVALGSGFGLFQLTSKWPSRQVVGVFGLVAFGGLALLTARTSLRANFINHDEATEYLVYAHMSRGPKEVLEQVEDISRRTTGDLGIRVAYDDETSYPYWWYLRNYDNYSFYGNTPGRDLRDYAVIIVGDANYGKIEPVVGQAFYEFEYIRIWWPNQDYFDFTQSSRSFAFQSRTGLPAEQMSFRDYLYELGLKLGEYLGTPEMREALWDIWLNRDFQAYFLAKGQNFDLTSWQPSRTMRMYVRKDIAAQIWDYGVAPAAEATIADPYEGKGVELAADLTVGEAGSAPGQFNSPRGVAVAPDGSVYVADANNHRIQQFAADGSLIRQWGTPSNAETGETGPGTFAEPWSVAVSPDGEFVYVADTWNHRIQQFTAEGEFVSTWGAFSQTEDAFGMWGPRDVLVDSEGNVLVTDTGNKRIKIYDADGNFLSQYGGFGFDLGFFDEPVGLALDGERGRLYVADTWNQRVQVFDYADGALSPVEEWPIAGWYGQSLQNKPYLSVGADGRVYISDPEGGRVLVYEPDGTFLYYFGGYDQQAVQIGIAQGVAADGQGGLWVTDSENGRLLHFEAE